jgi:hypothetical protein
VARPLFEFITTANTICSIAAEITDNFSVNKFEIIYPTGTYDVYPTIYEANNFSQYFASQYNGGRLSCAIGDSYIKNSFSGKLISMNVASLGCHTFLLGSQWNYTQGPIAFTRKVIGGGTTGSLSGVTATLVNGNNYATFTGGTASEKAKVHAGSYIQIGTSGQLIISHVLGDIIYLRSTYAGTTQTSQQVSFIAPAFRNEFTWPFDYTPETYTYVRGDIAWKKNPAAGESPGWICTSSGTPGTWKAMANLAS